MAISETKMKLAQANRDLEKARGFNPLDPSTIINLRNTVEGYERGVKALEEEFASLFPA